MIEPLIHKDRKGISSMKHKTSYIEKLRGFILDKRSGLFYKHELANHCYVLGMDQ